MTRQDACLIGVDAGTTGLKSLAFDPAGNVLCHAYREYPLNHPKPGHAEQDPELWWQALCETLREVMARGGISAGRVAGLSISSQGSAFVVLGEDGRPVRPAVSWLDQRSASLAGEDGFDENELFAITGLRAYPGWTGSVLQWLAREEPETLRRMACLLLVGDYLVWRMTGVRATDYSSASRTRMFNLEKRCWAPSLIAPLGIRESQLPPLYPSGHTAGSMSADAARATGLAPGTPVVLGGFDQSCAALGAGAVTPDTLMVSLGTASMLVGTSAQPVTDPLRRVTTSCHVAPGHWTLQAPIMTTGAILRWWRDLFSGHPSEDAYAEMDRAAAAIPPGADGVMVLPHFGGAGAPHWDHTWRGAITGLGLNHTRAHVMRGIMEGVAMEICGNLDIIEHLGLAVEEVRIVGGGAKSALWTGIIGDVIGKPRLCFQQAEVGARGAAMLAGLGVGLFVDVPQAVGAMAPKGIRHDFDPDNHRTYRMIRRGYLDLSAKLYGHAAGG